MKITVPGLLAAFLAGVLGALLWTMQDDPPEPRPTAPRASPATASAPAAGGEHPRGQIPASSAPESSATPEQVATVGLGAPLPEGTGFVQRGLREILQSPDAERVARVAIFLAEMRQQAATDPKVILDYLRTGADMKVAQLGGDLGITGPNPTIRHCLITTLFEAEAEDSQRTTTHARAIITDAKSAGEVQVAVAAMQKFRLEADVLPEVEAAVRRLFPQGKPETLSRALELAGQLHSETLFRDCVAEAERSPKFTAMGSLLPETWNFSDETRLEVTRRLLAVNALRDGARTNPNYYRSLDATPPEFRQAVVDDFRTEKEEARMYLLRSYATGAATDAKRYRNDLEKNSPPSTRAPGSPAQTAARLQLLDELAPYCNSPLLQQHLEDARASLRASAPTP